MGELSTHSLEVSPERHASRDKCFHPSGLFVEFPKEEIEQSIPERFEKIVRLYPDRIAVKTKSRTLTYKDLNQQANSVSHALLKERGKMAEPIAVMIEHGAEIIAAILGVLKAGKLYVALNPNDPVARNISILKDSQTGLLLTGNHASPLVSAAALGRLKVLNVSDLGSSICDENPGLFVAPNTLAHIGYTSGSTGTPKGVTQNHRNVLHKTMVYTNYLHICVEDRLTLLHTCSFAACLNHLCGALLNGAALFPFDIENEGVTPLARYLAEEKITIYHSVPGLFRNFVNTITASEDLSKLRVVHLSGEAATKQDIELYKKHFSSDCMLLHRLGSREAQGIFWYLIDKTTEIKGARVPVGSPAEDTEVLLFDKHNKRIEYGEVGEIVVGSRYLSPGYWRRPDLTQAAFLTDPAGGEIRFYLTGDLGRQRSDGCYEHLGRKDSSVKIRGYKVELAELENALLNLDGIEEAAVRPWQQPSGEQQLVAYVAANRTCKLSVNTLCSSLKEILPDYMVPSRFVIIESLPRTSTGKVDRRALPNPGHARPNLDTPYAAPRTPVEERLARVWEKVLSLDHVGIHDNFFHLGGHSLAATRLISRVIQEFHLELPIKALFESPTVAAMSTVILQHEANQAGAGDLERILNDVEAMSDEEAERVLKNLTGKVEQ